MKKLLPIIFLIAFFRVNAATQPDFPTESYLQGPSPAKYIVNPYAATFEKAYSLYPEIPKGMLEAVAFCNTRFEHIIHGSAESTSCIGYPNAYGVMGLTLDGKGYFANNLITVSELSNISTADIIADPEKNILAYARAFAVVKNTLNIRSSKVEDNLTILMYLSELPYSTEGQLYAYAAQEYGYVQFLTNPDYQKRYGFPDPVMDPVKFFGAENYAVLSSSSVSVSEKSVKNKNGNEFHAKSMMSTDYGPALWNPALSCNYNVGRGGTAISAVTIHDIEGTYAGCISWFQNCSASVSAHYVLRSSDGQITQMVLEADKAWHVGSENGYTIGLEHEGYVSSASWYTTAMYNSSAALVRDICASGYGINPLRCYYGPGCTGSSSSCQEGGCITIKGHQMYPYQTHDDPGPNWNWYYYYEQINNSTPVTSLTTSTGNFYDSGGPAGNYSDDERTMTLIHPAGATSITLTVNSFNIENNWDYLYIYDGNSTSAPLIGTYTGTTIPATISSTGGEMLIQFRSDCATVAAGWNFSWTSTAASIVTPGALTVNASACPNIGVNLSWTSSGSGWYLDISDDPSFTTFYNKDVSGLTSVNCPGGFCEYPGCASYLKFRPGTTYYWRIWNGTTETAGSSFTTPICAFNDASCSGTLDDTGGPGAAYTGNEDYTYTIAPAGATSISMNFSSFDLENGFDSLYIHDGSTTAAALIGAYTGTVSPGSFTSTGGSVTLHFVSDPFTNNAGFVSSWTCTALSTDINESTGSGTLTAYPNPFSGTTTLSYFLNAASSVKIALCDVLGKELILLNTEQSQGKHDLLLNASELDLAKGMYFVKMKVNEEQKTIKVILK
ncbi:MAG: CUB domain-containing protein [Bacteroidia bacterium]